MSTPEIQRDAPMNLEDEKLLEDPEKLPHMRFLMNDKGIFDLSI